MISSEELGARIALWRKRRQQTQATLAGQVGVSRTTLVAVEKGQRRPSNRELLAISEALDVRLHDLLKEHAVAGSVAPRFRFPPGARIRKKILEDAVETTRALGTRYVELERVLDIPRVPAPLESLTTYRVPGPGRWGDPVRAGEHAARTVRSWMDVGDAPVFGLDTLLEVHAGLRIFYRDFDSRIAAVFLWGDELGGCIAVNRLHPYERRRWGLAHEFAHFLRDRESGEILLVDGSPRRDESEVFADRFADEYLLPAMGVWKYFSDVSRGSRFTVADVLQMAHFFGVSFEAVLRRLEELGLVPRGTKASITATEFRIRDAEGHPDLRSARPRPGRFPERYELLALTAFRRELISETELAEYLECDRVEARAVYNRQRQVLGDEGLLEIDLTRDLLAGRED